MMNETVYLFALSLPALLDRLVTDRDDTRPDSVPPQPPVARS